MSSTKANKNIYYAGDHKSQCDVCGFVYLASECKKTWDNLISCPDCFDIKQPQLTIRGKADRQAVRNARPESENDSDLPFGSVSPEDI